MKARSFGLFAGIALSLFLVSGPANADGNSQNCGGSQSVQSSNSVSVTSSNSQSVSSSNSQTVSSSNCQNVSSSNSQTVSSASSSGTVVSVPLDLDGDSCSTVNGSTVCADASSYVNYAGESAAFGYFTGQNVGEYDSVSGSGCNIGGKAQPIAGCTLSGSSEQGCQFHTVTDAEVDRYKPNGDLLLSAGKVTICEDLSSGPPFNYTVSSNLTITGGTGKFAGASGTITGTGHGQELLADPAGHGFSWFVTDSVTETITLAGNSD